MPISAIEQITLVNQNLSAASVPQINFLNRIELQNIAAAAAINEKEEEIEDLNDIEVNQGMRIDPDLDHEKENKDQSSEEKEIETIKSIRKKVEKEKEFKSPYHFLDIKV